MRDHEVGLAHEKEISPRRPTAERGGSQHETSGANRSSSSPHLRHQPRQPATHTVLRQHRQQYTTSIAMISALRTTCREHSSPRDASTASPHNRTQSHAFANIRQANSPTLAAPPRLPPTSDDLCVPSLSDLPIWIPKCRNGSQICILLTK